ncbi:MAG: alkaline phosphatase family protein [Cyclobacteriaceae bacterium]
MSKKNSVWAQEQPYLVLISFDGFRYDYAEKCGAKNILQFLSKGVTTSSMTPAFPSKTFPNHYTIVTGMYPSTHGIVSNEFYSRKKNDWYKVGNGAIKDGSWYGGVPIWSLAEKNEMLTASYFWIGSEAEIQGFMPTYMKSYNSAIPNKKRFDQVIDWLEMDAELRPHLITAYFSSTDDAGHDFGPESQEVRSEVLRLDSLFGDFIDQLQEIELPINVMIVSDHGMSIIDQGVVLPEIVDLSAVRVSKSFPPMIYSDDKEELERISAELKKDGRIALFSSDSIPSEWHFEKTERVGDLILYTEAPTIILQREMEVSGGTHGFNPYLNKEMGSFFAAAGSSFKKGIKLEPFESIHLYPMMVKVLGLDYEHEIDGKPEVLDFVLVKPED